MLKRNIFYILFTLTLVGILGFSYISEFSERSPVTSCQEWGFYSSKDGKYYAHPEKIVFQPWHGRHHVYAIFMIPNGYINDFLLTVKIQGIKTICGTTKNRGASFEGISAKPGYYLVQGFLNTRTGVWLITQGKTEELKQLDNWVIGYTKKDEA